MFCVQEPHSDLRKIVSWRLKNVCGDKSVSKDVWWKRDSPHPLNVTPNFGICAHSFCLNISDRIIFQNVATPFYWVTMLNY